MNLKKLKMTGINPSDILILIKNFNCDDFNNLKSYKQQYKSILKEIDDYSKNNGFTVSYFEAAKTPLWKKIAIPEESVIIKGFTGSVYANTRTDKFDDVNIRIKLDNGVDLSVDEVLSMIKKNEFQLNLIKKIIETQEARLLKSLSDMWEFEKQRINIWLSNAKISVKYLNQ